MKKFFLALSVWFITIGIALGSYVDVPEKNRIYNASGSQCMWCACETTCRVLGIKEGYTLTQQYKHATSFTFAVQALRARGISCGHMSGRGTWAKIEEYLNAGHPVVFGVPGHAMLIVGYDEETYEVKVIDNGHNRSVQTWSWKRFSSVWDGNALFIWSP